VIGRACPDGYDEAEEAAGEVVRVGARVELEQRQDLGEQTESAFDVRFVLGTLCRRADAERQAERSVDVGRVIGRLVVEEQRDRRRARRRDTVLERLDDGCAVFCVAHGRPHEGAGMRVDVELDVEHEALAIDDDGHLHPVADPLRAREIRPKRAAERALVRTASFARRRHAAAVRVEDPSHEIATEGHAQIALHMLAELDEGALPARVGVEHGLDVQHLDVAVCGHGGRALGQRVCIARRIADPVFESAERNAHCICERALLKRRVLRTQREDEASKTIGVALSLRAAIDAAGMAHHVPEHLARRIGVARRRGRFLRGPPRRAHECRQDRHELAHQLVRVALRRARRLHDRIDRRAWQTVTLGERTCEEEHGGDPDGRKSDGGEHGATCTMCLRRWTFVYLPKNGYEGEAPSSFCPSSHTSGTPPRLVTLKSSRHRSRRSSMSLASRPAPASMRASTSATRP
jgi:hypothetical protein